MTTLATITPAQVIALLGNKTITVPIGDGRQVTVMPELVRYAINAFKNGDEIVVLPEVIGEGRMEEIRIKK